MGGWFPSGDLTTLYGLILLCAAILVLWTYRRSDARHIAGLLFLSWLLARTATWFDFMPLQGAGTLILAAAFVLIGTHLALLMACLFGFKLITYALESWGLMAREDMWLSSEIIAYIAIGLMLIGGYDGRIRFLDWFGRTYSGGGHLDRLRIYGRKALGFAFPSMGRD